MVKLEKEIKRMAEIDINLIRENDPELAKRIYLLYQNYQELAWKLSEAMKAEHEARSQLVSVMTENSALKKEVETLRTNLTKLRMQLEEQTQRRMQLELEHKDILLRSEIVQHAFAVLLDKLDTLYEKVAEKYTREPIEDIRHEMREDFEAIASQIRSIMETLVVPRAVTHEKK